MLGHGRLSPPCSSLWWRYSISAGLRMPRIAASPDRSVAPAYRRRAADAADRSASAADRSSAAAEEQTKIQRQLRIDSAQPYVWADVRPDDESGFILTLI